MEEKVIDPNLRNLEQVLNSRKSKYLSPRLYRYLHDALARTWSLTKRGMAM